MQIYTQFVISNSTKQDAIDRVEKNSNNVRAFFKVNLTNIKITIIICLTNIW